MSSKLAEYFHLDRLKSATVMVDVASVRESVDSLLCLLYPQRGCERSSDFATTETHLILLQNQFADYFSAVAKLSDSKFDAAEVTKSFFDDLPKIAKILDSDVEAAFQGDPAAYSKEEIIITYPGFYAICIHRLAHSLYRLNIPLIPRLMSEYAHEKTGIDIHPGATIAESFFVDHGTGVVIGETTVIGKRVKIYQGVTLGALSVKKKLQSKKRHPTIEEDVVIYANATILGGETVVGKGCVIGGNVWITESVEPGTVITLPGR